MRCRTIRRWYAAQCRYVPSLSYLFPPIREEAPLTCAQLQHTDRGVERERERERQTDRQPGRQAGRQAGRQTGRQAERERERDA